MNGTRDPRQVPGTGMEPKRAMGLEPTSLSLGSESEHGDARPQTT